MGLILDSSVLIAAERQGQNARQMLTAISGIAGDTEIAISVVTLVELAHGAARPKHHSEEPSVTSSSRNCLQACLSIRSR